MHLSKGEDLLCVIVCIVISIACLIFRAYSLKKHSTRFTKLIWIGLCSIIFAVLLSCIILGFPLSRYSLFLSSYCEILFRLSVLFYVFHRLSFYAFNVWRIDLVNSYGAISSHKIFAIWWSILAFGLLFIAGPLFMTETKNNYLSCPIRMKQVVVLVGAAFDITICLLTSWLFVYPLVKGLKDVEEKAVHKTVVKEIFCVATLLLSKVVAVTAIIFFDDIVHIAGGFDAALTTCCLVVISSPVKTSNFSPVESSKRSYFCFECLGRGQKLETVRAILSDLTLQLSNLLPKPKTSSMRLAEEMDQILEAISFSELDSPLMEMQINLGQQSIIKSAFLLNKLGDIKEENEFSKSTMTCSSRTLKLSTIRLIEYVDEEDSDTDILSERYTNREDMESGDIYPSYEIKLSIKDRQ